MSLHRYYTPAMMREHIVAAAIEHVGVVYSVPPPGRHHNVCWLMIEAGLPVDAQRYQGFLTSTGRFVGREEAVEIARAAGQILKKTPPENRLFSEDLW